MGFFRQMDAVLGQGQVPAAYIGKVHLVSVSELPVGSAAEAADGKAALHTLTLQPRHPGIVFEKIVVDFGGYKPSYLFMDESPLRRL